MNNFDCAIKMEEESTKYYEALSVRASDPELKNLFAMLAQAEKEHYDNLVKLKESVDARLPQFKALEQAACLFRPLLAKRELMAQLKKEPDAYQLVVAQEEKGVQFYQELADQAKDRRTREVLLKIADEERKHLSIVENIYNFVESPKNFLVSGEFSNLKEY